jgi:hypothetical protein
MWSTRKPETIRKENVDTTGKEMGPDVRFSTSSATRTYSAPSTSNNHPSRIRATSIPFPSNSIHHPILVPRRASLSQTQYDKLWWREVARRGSTTRADRRFSILEPIIEPPHTPGYAGSGRVECEWTRSPSRRRVSEEMKKEVERDMRKSGFGRVIWREGEDVRRENFGR